MMTAMLLNMIIIVMKPMVNIMQGCWWRGWGGHWLVSSGEPLIPCKATALEFNPRAWVPDLWWWWWLRTWWAAQSKWWWIGPAPPKYFELVSVLILAKRQNWECSPAVKGYRWWEERVRERERNKARYKLDTIADTKEHFKDIIIYTNASGRNVHQTVRPAI